MMAGRGVQLVIVVSRSSVGGQNSEEELKLVDYGSQQKSSWYSGVEAC